MLIVLDLDYMPPLASTAIPFSFLENEAMLKKKSNNKTTGHNMNFHDLGSYNQYEFKHLNKFNA